MKEALSIGVRRTVFTGWGEPAVHPMFLEFIEKAEDLGFGVVVNTNGSKLGSLAYNLVKLGIDEIYAGINAFDLKLYASIRRFGDLSRVTRGLLALKKAGLENHIYKPVVKAILTVTRANVNELPKALGYAVDMGISEVIISNYIPYRGAKRS